MTYAAYSLQRNEQGPLFSPPSQNLISLEERKMHHPVVEDVAILNLKITSLRWSAPAPKAIRKTQIF
jgi:hypothetical protein